MLLLLFIQKERDACETLLATGEDEDNVSVWECVPCPRLQLRDSSLNMVIKMSVAECTARLMNAEITHENTFSSSQGDV